MSDQGLSSFVDKWLAVQPAQRIALDFVAAERRAGSIALAALEQELISAAYGIREPQVAAVKLNWWAEELSGAAASGGRHPLTQTLFGDERVNRIEPEHWLAPIRAALAQGEAATAPDFSAQLEAADELHGALARLEVRWWFGVDADPTRAARMACLGHLLWQSGGIEKAVEHDRLPLPMSRLARHGLTRDALGHDNPARRAALREQLADIADAYVEAWRLPGPLSVFRGLDARLGSRLARRSARAAEPVERLRTGLSAPAGPATAFRAWTAARASARHER